MLWLLRHRIEFFDIQESCVRNVNLSRSVLALLLSCLFRGKKQVQVCELNQMSEQRLFGAVALVHYKPPSGFGRVGGARQCFIAGDMELT